MKDEQQKTSSTHLQALTDVTPLVLGKTFDTPVTPNEQLTTVQFSTMPATSETQVVHKGFTVNTELIISIIMDFMGIFMYFNGKDKIGSIITQLMSVVKNGSLDLSGYLFE